MRQIWKWLIVGPIVAGIIVSAWITFRNQIVNVDEKNKLKNLFENSSSKTAEVTKFYTYGTSLNIEGKIKGISKDNLEGMKLALLDGQDFEQMYNINYSFEGNDIIFSTKENMNKAIELDELQSGKKYYLQLRIKANNSKDYKYYTLSKSNDYKNIVYYTLTKENKNKKVDIKFESENYNNKKYSYLGITVSDSKLPKNVYDIVIDSGHGGTDNGEVSGDVTESSLMLEYGKALKESLEEKGYKVKLSRDDSNTDSFTSKNMYDENGRISICCKTKAKYMLSLHTADEGGNGIEVYIPNNSNIELAEKIANNLYNLSSLEFSDNKSYKIQDGIYQKNYNNNSISKNNSSMEKQGIEPYNLTTDTPNLYTIREVGGIATNAYVDGRNTSYGANKYYNSNQGIECYQIEFGKLKVNKETFLNEKEQIVKAISDVF